MDYVNINECSPLLLFGETILTGCAQSLQPRVARNELPWVGMEKATNSERVESDFPACRRFNFFQSWLALMITQGRPLLRPTLG